MLIDSPESTGSLIVSGSIIPEALSSENGIHDLGSLSKPFRDLYITTSSLTFVRNGMAVSVINGGDDYIQVGNIIIGTSSISYASGSAGDIRNIITVDTNSADNMVVIENDATASSYTGSFSGSFMGDGSGLNNVTAVTASHVADAYISSSVSLNTITFTHGDNTTDTVVVHTGSLPDGLYSSSAQISSSGFLTSASAAEEGFGSGGGAGLSATDIANISGAFDSGSVAGNVLSLTTLGGTTTSYTIDTGSGGGGGATDISALNTFTGSANIRINTLSNATASYVTNADTASFITNSDTASFVTNADTASFITNDDTASFLDNSDTGSLLTTASVSENTITFTKGDASTFDITVDTGSGGGGGGTDVTTTQFNNNYRYYVPITSTARLQLQSSGDYFYDRSWNRSGTTINVTSSAHGLGTGDVVALRNASEDNVIAAVTNIDANHFSMTVANSGGTSGTAAGYVPLFSGSITETSGDVTAVSITAPGALSGSAVLHGFQIYGSNMESSPMQVTLPAGANEGAGLYGSKLGINIPHVTALNIDGTGVSGNVTVSPQMNLGSSFNVLRLNGVDNFSSLLIKCTFF